MKLKEEKINLFLEKHSLEIDTELMEVALTHSIHDEIEKHKMIEYQRYELLGDSVINLVIVDFLLHHLKDKSLGEITRKKSFLVSKDFLSFLAKKINLQDYIITQSKKDREKIVQSNSVLEDTFEAFIGVIYFQKGLNYTKEWFLKKVCKRN